MEVWYKYLYNGKDDPVQIRLSIRLANEGSKGLLYDLNKEFLFLGDLKETTKDLQ